MVAQILTHGFDVRRMQYLNALVAQLLAVGFIRQQVVRREGHLTPQLQEQSQQPQRAQ